MKWLLGFWYAHLRRLDVELLWPQCCKYAPNVDNARAGFAVHAFHDKAWLVLGRDEIVRRIDQLTMIRD